MYRALTTALSLLLIALGLGPARAQSVVTQTLLPIHDTWATHDDGLAHGAEPEIKVGIEPQACIPGGSYDPCPKQDLECCTAPDGYNYCAAPGECATTAPSWAAFRMFRGYMRFDLSELPAGKVVKATLRLVEVSRVEDKGGPVKVYVYRLKSIGKPGQEVCEWSESSLSDTEGTTWSSLPQNASFNEADGAWLFDVTKALVDWLEGDPDKPGTPPAANCGFHLVDPDFGTAQVPLQRWVNFSSKEGPVIPQLTVTIAQDLDNDGFAGDVDCEDTNPEVNPGALDLCGDGIDNDCDGVIDGEVCDGYDNDCDGLVDEGDPAALCGEGEVCVLSECKPACKDECEGPYDKACAFDPVEGWSVLGCGQSDGDPCKDWFEGEVCPAGWYCNYGSCSTNCLDLCETEGARQCETSAAGEPIVQACQDTDGDGCLDWELVETCPAGMTCEDGACAGTACEDACPALGATECVGDLVRACYAFDGAASCLAWSPAAPCPSGPCLDGVCTEQATIAEPSPDAGSTDPDAGSAQDVVTAVDVVEDTGTGTPDVAFDSAGPPIDVATVEDSGTEPVDTSGAPVDSGTTQPDAGGFGDAVVIGLDQAGGGNVTVLDTSGGAAPSDDPGGCSCDASGRDTGGAPPAGTLVLLGLVLFAVTGLRASRPTR